MNIAVVQLDSAWADKAGNFARVESLIDAAQVTPGSLVVLPEMFATGFCMDSAVTAEPEGGETEEFLGSIARRHRVAVIGGLVGRGAGGLARNEAVAMSPDGGLIARYAKQRPFSGAGEDAAYARGAGGVTFALGGFTIAPLICYDLRFPELFRDAVRDGAALFVVIAAWPAARIGHWTALLRARAIENQAAVIGVNRTGREPQVEYCGGSLVVDAQGSVVAESGESECVVKAVLDPEKVRAWRSEFPALRDAGLA